MKKMIAVGITTILTIGLSGCSWFQPAEPAVEQPTVTKTQDQVTESTKIKVPEETQVEKSTLKMTKEDKDSVYYEGEITISGKYTLSNPEGDFMGLCFYPDADTGSLIPRDTDDSRIPFFCFSNEEADQMLGINREEIFVDSTVECIEGNATISVSNYVLTKIEGAVWDKAELEKVISKEPYSLECKN